MSRPERIPCLDGLRAVAVLMVLAGHAANTVVGTGGRWTVIMPWAGRYASLGVLLFFVLSGYLITGLLLREQALTGRISLGAFYLRRALRIWPVFFAYIAVMAIFTALGVFKIGVGQLVSAATFTWNYKHVWSDAGGDGEWYLGHFWTLAVEQQFYLLWPLALWSLSRVWAGRLAVILLVLGPALRVGTYYLWPAARPQTGIMFHTMMDPLLVGSLLALGQGSLLLPRVLQRLSAAIWPLLGVGFVLLVSPWLRDHFRGSYALPIGISLESIVCGFILAWLVGRPHSLAGRLLEWSPLRWLGRLSYSLYVWNQPFLTPLNTSWSGLFPLNLACNLAVACLSYYGLEKPLVALRRRFQAVATSGS